MTQCNKTHRSVQRRNRSIAFYALVLALVLRSLIPTGFMPNFNPDSSGAVTLEICTPSGAYFIDMPFDDEVTGEKHRAGDHQPCAFASFTPPLFHSTQVDTDLVFAPQIGTDIISEQGVDLPFFAIFGAPVGLRAPPSVIL